jgi:hypothetical protein
MDTIGRDLRVGDGQVWYHKGKYLGKLLNIETSKDWRGDVEQVYTFEKGNVTGFDAKFTTSDPSATTVRVMPARTPSVPEDYVDGKRLVVGRCYSHKGQYLGAYQSMRLVGSPYDPDPEYVFSKGKKSGLSISFTEVPCQAGGRKSRRRSHRQKHRRSLKNRGTRRH